MPDFLLPVIDFINSTHITEQVRAVDVHGLFTNPYFLVPFIALIGYLLYKQSINYLVLVGIGLGLWIFSGSSYMQGLIVEGRIQIGKILPVAGVWIVAIAVAIYFLFMRSE